VSGSKFYYLKGAAALLELALVNWAYSRVAAQGFTTLATPDLVRMDVLEKCGFQPRMENTQVGLWEGTLGSVLAIQSVGVTVAKCAGGGGGKG
jgi:seryl-tRNA synthetase